MGLFRKDRTSQAPSAEIPERPLSSWRSGEEGVITRVPGSSVLFSRLRELGVVPGVLIRVLRSSCPLVIQVGEGRLCLRKQDAASILVCSPHAPDSPLHPSLRL